MSVVLVTLLELVVPAVEVYVEHDYRASGEASQEEPEIS